MSIAIAASPTSEAAQRGRAVPAQPQPDPTFNGQALDSPAIVPATGRLRDEALTSQERNWSVALHLSPLGTMLAFGIGFLPAVVLPLVLWLVRRNESTFNDDAGREVINFCITFFILNLILGVTIVGWPVMPVLWVIGLVAMIRGAIAAGRGEYFRYPMTWRFLS